MAKKAKKAVAKKARKTKKAATGARPRYKWDDDAKIIVVGENKKREGSVAHKAYEAMKKIKTVAGYAKSGHDRFFLRKAVNEDGYAKIG